MKECTFRPQISSKNLGSEGDPGLKKYDQLYNLSKVVSPREEKSKSLIEFEKSKGECTFKPKINKKYIRQANDQEPARNFDKSVVRMYEARKIREEKDKNMAVHPDNPLTRRVCKTSRSRQEEDSP